MTPFDNNWHPNLSPGYVEWWYLDAIFQTGDTLSGSLGLWGNLGNPMEVVVRSDFFLRRPSGMILPFGEVVSYDAFCASETTCDVRLGQQRLLGCNGGYRLSLANQQSEGGLDLTYTPWGPGFSYRHDFLEGGHFCWEVAAPLAEVNGRLFTPEAEIPLNGVGYHDHNWSSVPIMKMFNGWEWGRMHAPAGTLIFARVLGQQQALFHAVYWLAHGSQYPKIYIGPEPCLHVEKAEHSQRLWASQESLHFDLTMTRPNILVRRSVNYSYGRFLSQGAGGIAVNNDYWPLDGPVLHEVQRFEPEH